MDENDRFRKYVYSRLLIIPPGGLACAVTMLLRGFLYNELGFLPATLRTLAMDFKSDSPRTPRLEILPLPPAVWEQVMFRDSELALLNNFRNTAELVQEIEKPDGRLHWLMETGLYWPKLIERYHAQEAG